MRRLFSWLGVAVSSVLVAGCGAAPPDSSVLTSQQFSDRQQIVLEIGEHQLSVEAVTAQPSIILGLGERDSIGSDGMLFMLGRREPATFWMRGMRFGLDMIWIDNGTITGITASVPAPENPAAFDLPTYASPGPVTHVLELAAGRAEALGLQAGDTVRVGGE
jgi:uncharacterized protein